MTRGKAVPALVVALTALALVAILLLQSQANSGRQAQVRLSGLKSALTALQSDPFRASPTTGGSPAIARTLMKRHKQQVAQALAGLRQDSPLATLAAVAVPLRANYAALGKIYAIGASGRPYGMRADLLSATAARTESLVSQELDQAAREYDSRGSTADLRATIGSVAAIVLLLGAFLLLYRRSTRARSVAEAMARENELLATASNKEARTDALTGLGNRRALLDDLERELTRRRPELQLAVVLFDLDGFKNYNDVFGHPAGDTLLARLAGHLARAVAETGMAYRMGGDEFCVLAWIEANDAEAFAQRGGESLMESGEAFEIGCSYGFALAPAETSTSEEALQLADRRMYADKAGRSSASRQSADVLLEVLNERSLDLREHIQGVATRASLTAERLGFPDHEVSRIGLAAELHDVGKAAIPDTILRKPGPLDPSEQRFIRSHTIIGERILLAAPSLAPLAGLVRSSHERFDGKGYPDGLGGAAIPRGARVIAVCDAFDAMRAGRPYREAVSEVDARDELRRQAGSQFDPAVVDAFLAVVEAQPPAVAAA
jgi:diguanylate cyclase (GGDEF)-like protein